MINLKDDSNHIREVKKDSSVEKGNGFVHWNNTWPNRVIQTLDVNNKTPGLELFLNMKSVDLSMC